MRDGPDCVFNGGFYEGWYQGQEAKVWWGAKSYWRISNQAHASSFLQARRMKSTQPDTSLGSSPRMRGKHADQRDDIVHDGLIPAHTGNAVIGAVAVEPGGAHPRAYGERRTLQHPEHF